MPSRFDVRPRKNNTDLLLDVEESTVAAAYEHERPAKVLNALTKGNILIEEQDGAAALRRYVLHNKTMAIYHDAPRAVLEAYQYLYDTYSEPDDRLPVVRMSLDPIDIFNSRYGVQIELAWPDCDEDIAATFATERMQAFARHLYNSGKSSERVRQETIYAQANRRQGVLFQTNPMGSCSIESDHRDYTGSRTVDLGQHNIHNAEQQLICLVGAVAFANADNRIQ